MTETYKPITTTGLARRYKDALYEDATPAVNSARGVCTPIRLYSPGPWRVVFTNVDGAGHAPISSPPLGIVHEAMSMFVPWHAVISLYEPLALPPRDPEKG